MKQILYISLFLVLTPNLFAQKKIDISAGYGFYDLGNIGIYYNFDKNFQTGIKFGVSPDDIEYASSKIFLFNYFYSGNSIYTQQPPWYVHVDICNYSINGQSLSYQCIMSNLRHGRVFNISKHFALRAELGIDIVLSYEDKTPDSDNSTFYQHYPSMVCDFYYRF